MKYSVSIDEVTGVFYSTDYILVSCKDIIRGYDFEYNLLWKSELSGNVVKCSIYQQKAYVEIIDKESGFERTTVVDLKSGDFLLNGLTDLMIRSVSVDGNAIALKYNSDYSTNILFIRLQSEEVIWEKELLMLPLFLDGHNLISGIKNLISSFDNDSTKLWEFDLSQLGTWIDYNKKEKAVEFSRILDVHENQIYLYLNSGKVLVLNVETGEKTSVLENDKNTDQGSFSGMFMNAIELDESKGKLIQLFNQRYTEVNLNTKVVTQTHLEDMKSLNLENMSRFVFDDDHIYFTDKNHHKLGALNRSALKIDWTYELSQEEISKSEQPRYGRELKLRGNNLLVLDNKNTLHIFEKQASHPA